MFKTELSASKATEYSDKPLANFYSSKFCFTVESSSSRQIPAERCILHIGDGGRGGQLRKIEPNSWEKILQASRTRKGKKEFESSKYKHIVETLPASFDDSMGYHPRSYSNFMSCLIINSKLRGRQQDRYYQTHAFGVTNDEYFANGVIFRRMLILRETNKNDEKR